MCFKATADADVYTACPTWCCGLAAASFMQLCIASNAWMLMLLVLLHSMEQAVPPLALPLCPLVPALPFSCFLALGQTERMCTRRQNCMCKRSMATQHLQYAASPTAILTQKLLIVSIKCHATLVFGAVKLKTWLL